MSLNSYTWERQWGPLKLLYLIQRDSYDVLRKHRYIGLGWVKWRVLVVLPSKACPFGRIIV